MTKQNREYRVEGWARGSCVSFRTMRTAPGAVREATRQVLDEGATMVWVYSGTTALFTLNEALIWQRHGGDERLAAAIEKEQA